MTDDEKRELIAGLRTRAKYARLSGEDARLMAMSADALEGTLDEGEWEYGYELWDNENGESDARGWEWTTAEEAREYGERRAAEENWANKSYAPEIKCVVVRRRKAGPWERVEQ